MGSQNLNLGGGDFIGFIWPTEMSKLFIADGDVFGEFEEILGQNLRPLQRR